MSTYAIPIVGDIVDGGVDLLDDNWLYRLPLVGGLLKLAVTLALTAAAVFAVALTLGGGLYYTWPSIVSLAPRHLGAPSGGYWAYVVLVLALYMLVLAIEFVRDLKKADVLHAQSRDDALDALAEPAMLIMLVWLVTTYIA